MRVAISLALGLLLVACGRSNELEWVEDVRLPNGTRVTLNRWVEFNGGSGQLGEQSTESRQSFEFKMPVTGELVKWQSDSQRGLLKTVALWIEGGTPKLLTRPSYGRDKRKFHCPNPIYLLFEYVDGSWRSQPLSQIKLARIRANLTTHPLEKRDEIEQSKRRLTEVQTSNSVAYYKGVRAVPYIVKFEGMPLQTFDTRNCTLGPDSDDLVAVDGE